MRVLLAALVALLPFGARANDCAIEFALGEQLGPPQVTQQTITVHPYDSSGTGGRLAACAATAANLDVLGREFADPASPPSGVLCSALAASWNAAERVDLVLTGLSPNTLYHYKVLCDPPNPNPGSLWGHRPMRSFRTLPTEDADSDFHFTFEADPHYGTILKGFIGRCHADGSWGTTFSQDALAWQNMENAIADMAKRRGTFHVNVGDYYQADGAGGADDPANPNACERSLVFSPVIAATEFSGIGSGRTIPAGTYLAQIPGYPTRDVDGCSVPGSSCLAWSRNIQQTRTDANVKARAKWLVWAIHKAYNAIFGSSALVFAWGNHDCAKWPAVYEDLAPQWSACVGTFTNDNQGTPKVAWEHMAEAWSEINVNPAGSSYYPPQPLECDPSGDPFDPPCNGLGHYYRFAAGLAEFWILNPFEASGGLGNPTTSTGWDLTGQAPNTANEWSLGAAQWNWLNTTLSASNAKWKFVLSHHPVGGVDVKDAGATGCYWYARGGAFATSGFYCDVNGNDVDDGVGEKECTLDDSIGDLDGDTVDDGYDEATDNRPAGWKALYGACPAGVACKSPLSPYTPMVWANRTADMAGNHANGGQQALQSLLAANLDGGGQNFLLLGHDHTTAGGCKQEPDGCSDVWYITGSQPQGSGDGGNWSLSNRFGQWFDYNHDGLPDYRTDGSPWPGPTDVEAGTIRQRGSERRGFFDVEVSAEGVLFDFIQTSRDIFPENAGLSVFAMLFGVQAEEESDFDGAAGADLESKRAADAPVVAVFNCDDASAPLEGSQSCSYAITASNGTITRDSGWADRNGITCADFLWHFTSDEDRGSITNFFRFRNDGIADGGNLRVRSDLNELWITSDADLVASPTVTWTEGTTYEVRFCVTPSTDLTELWMDACDPGDDNCDGKLDAGGTAVYVSPWGTGSFATRTADGSAAGVETDGYSFLASSSSDMTGKVDALGVCLHHPGGFKCGDNFE